MKLNAHVAPRILLGIGQAVIPRLELVEQQRSGLRLEHFNEQVNARHVGTCRTHSFPFALDVAALGMPVEEDVPQMLVSLLVEALRDDAEVRAELQRRQLRAVQARRPVRQPLGRLSRVFHCVPQRGHQMRFALTAPAQQHNRARFVRLRRLEDAKEVNGRIGDAQELGGRLLQGAGRLVGGEVDGRALEAFALELVA